MTEEVKEAMPIWRGYGSSWRNKSNVKLSFDNNNRMQPTLYTLHFIFYLDIVKL